VRNGDRIRLDVASRRIDVLIGGDEFSRRLREPPAQLRPVPERGYAALFQREVLQADEGCDFAFLRPPH
jgi:dihydroxy-acid dehydratase